MLKRCLAIIAAFSVTAGSLFTANAAPQKNGFTPVYFSDFGDNEPLAHESWGFSTVGVDVSMDSAEIEGNKTAKLKLSMENQTASKSTLKMLDKPIEGIKIMVSFDWYIGKINDKPESASAENFGEVRLSDKSNITFFTMTATNGSPVSFYAGRTNENLIVTDITDFEKWYNFEIVIDVGTYTVTVTATDLETKKVSSYTSPLNRSAFDGKLGRIFIGGVKTTGNDMTWTTYFDNMGFYSMPITANTIMEVDSLPYHTVFVGQSSSDPASLGLPKTVPVTLFDGSKGTAAVTEWKNVGAAWNQNFEGIYEFEATLTGSGGSDNAFNLTTKIYVYNRFQQVVFAREAEWLDRGVVATNTGDGYLINWRLLSTEYLSDITFNVYRNDVKINDAPLRLTNLKDKDGKPGDVYKVESISDGKSEFSTNVLALAEDYMSIKMQRPEGGVMNDNDGKPKEFTYIVNDCGTGDLDGDGRYEIIVKWVPTNSIDSASTGFTGSTIFDAYTLDGELLWRIDMGLNLTSGAHYHQFLVYDFDGDGKSEFLIKTADGTTVYGATDGKVDYSKVISEIGDPSKNGEYVIKNGRLGHISGGPEYISVFKGENGEVIDTVDFRFSIEKASVGTWGDSNYNRSDRFLACVAYLDGVTPSAIYCRGYYARTTLTEYKLVDGKLIEGNYYDSAENSKRGEGMGNHGVSVADVNNDGTDEIIYGSMVFNSDLTVRYVMDGKMGRVLGSHGDAMHVGAFFPDRSGVQIMGVHESTSVASMTLHDGATGETFKAFFANKDAGRGVCANLTSAPGYEYWGAAGSTVDLGGGVHNVYGSVVLNSNSGFAMNFALYWDGDLLHELLDKTVITKYDESAGRVVTLKSMTGAVSNNGSKSTPCLQADILGDWREEVILAAADFSEIRIYNTPYETEYRIYTLMHDPVYRLGIVWQNVAYNQPPHISFYLGEDIRTEVLADGLSVPCITYTNGVASSTANLAVNPNPVVDPSENNGTDATPSPAPTMAPSSTPTPAPENGDINDKNDNGNKDDDNGINIWVVAGIIGGVVIICAAAIVLIKKKKK